MPDRNLDLPSDEAPALRDIFAAAATALRHGQPAAGRAATLLEALGYTPDGSAREAGETPHRSRMLDVAARLPRVFQLAAPDAPGLAVFGAEVDPKGVVPWWSGRLAGVSGTGLSLRQAFETCIGEAVEFISGLERPTDAVPEVRAGIGGVEVDAATATMVAAMLEACGQPINAPVDWVSAQRLTDGKAVLQPADIAYRRDPTRRTIQPAGPLSLGYSAGVTFGGAVLHALLELIERDAAALWWRGGQRARLLPLEHPALPGAASMIRTLRGDRKERRSWLLDITTDLTIPTVAAVSFAPDGHGFCCGTATRTTLDAAAQSALREMCQMELAHHVARAKQRERGEAALNELDRHHISRFNDINAETCVLVHPLPPAPAGAPDAAAEDLVGVVRAIGPARAASLRDRSDPSGIRHSRGACDLPRSGTGSLHAQRCPASRDHRRARRWRTLQQGRAVDVA